MSRSLIGDSRRLIWTTFRESMSTAVTRWCWARRMALERPTYPVPTTVMFMFSPSLYLCPDEWSMPRRIQGGLQLTMQYIHDALRGLAIAIWVCIGARAGRWARSEEHTSELQSRENLVCRLLLEKKN